MADRKKKQGAIEAHFDPAFTARLALREKQIQQSYRPVIGIHKWFARRPGTVFRSLLLAEFECTSDLPNAYWRSHSFKGVIADPFMGGGTPIYEANRLGFHVVGSDINPIAFWIVRQALEKIDIRELCLEAEKVAADVKRHGYLPRNLDTSDSNLIGVLDGQTVFEGREGRGFGQGSRWARSG